jgi:hypothetical protein
MHTHTHTHTHANRHTHSPTPTQVIRDSALPAVASALMRSATVRLHHDHLLVKVPVGAHQIHIQHHLMSILYECNYRCLHPARLWECRSVLRKASPAVNCNSQKLSSPRHPPPPPDRSLGLGRRLPGTKTCLSTTSVAVKASVSGFLWTLFRRRARCA